MPVMIVDVHTHVFPPTMIARREELARADPMFAEMYGAPAARMATAEELLASMERAEVDASVAAGFWWSDAALVAEHADYLLEAAARAPQQIFPAVPLDLAAPLHQKPAATAVTLAARGARLLGELRVRGGGQAMADAAEAAAASAGLALLVHCSEVAGHRYPGKHGGLTPAELWSLAGDGAAPLIASHWGGGFPFYALMPEVRAVIDEGRLVFDTAATALLYEPRIYALGIELVGVGAVLWGSDFPLRDQLVDRREVERALPDRAQRAAVLGANAARLLRLATD